MYGSSYVIEHCCSERDKDIERKSYEYYVTDAIRLIGENIAGLTRGKYISKSWRELSFGEENAQKQKSGDEIAEEVISRAGLAFGGEQ